MNCYHNPGTPWPAGREIPPLLESLYRFLSRQPDNSLGRFELGAEALGPDSGWGPHLTPQTWSFLFLPSGSRLALCEVVQPPAVVYLGSDGDLHTVAESFEQFLLDWASNDIAIAELAPDDDDDDDDQQANYKKANKAFRAWLKKERVVAPEVTGGFDFAAYAEGDAPRRLAPGPGGPHTTSETGFAPRFLPAIETAGPTLGALLRLLGRPANDPALCQLTEQLFGKTPPQSIGHAKHSGSAGLGSNKLGLELGFERNVVHRDWPPIPVGKKALCPYFTSIHVGEKFDEPLPYQVDRRTTWADIETRFPDKVESSTCYLPLDADGRLYMAVFPYGKNCGVHLRVNEGRILSEDFSVQPVHQGAGVFVQWALERGWLNEEEFAGHASHLACMRQRSVRPAALVAAALQRGLWDTHLKDEPWLRDFAFAYFHNQDGFWITKDLIAKFGSREGEYGHDEPVFDDDAPKHFDSLFKVFDRQFALYQRKSEAMQRRGGL